MTPSFNSVRYLEETVRSVLLQGYPDLEYIIIDGGSRDGAVDIIKKYERWVSFWVSEKDAGYADAINKGFHRATGSIRAWLPASDLYAPGALFVANKYLAEGKTDFIFGRACNLSEAGVPGTLRPLPGKSLRQVSLYGRSNPCQPACLWTSRIHEQAGQLNTSLRLAADSEWFLRLSLLSTGRGIPEMVCFIRQHADQLSSNLDAMTREWYAAWNAVVAERRISRLRIFCGALFYAPLTRYRSGGIRRLLSVPNMAVMRRTLLGGTQR